MDGVININKPLGMTSHDVVACLRKILNMKKVGHTGTLDPEATGVLPVCVGKATKISELLMSERKQYVAKVKLGITTDTLDSAGEIIAISPVTCSETEIRDAVQSFVGDIEQVPPMYSAIKIDGKKLYELAREGKEVERAPRRITVFGIEITNIDMDSNTFSMRVDCSKGTYIRTLCADIGSALNCGAHMSELVRTGSGQFDITESFTLDEVEKCVAAGDTSFIRSIGDSLPQFEKVVVAEHNSWRIRNGIEAEVEGLDEGSSYCVYDESGTLLSISTQTDGKLKMLKSFYGTN